MAHCDPEWMELRELYCPKSGRLLEVEAVTSGYPVVHDFLPDIEGFYRGFGIAGSGGPPVVAPLVSLGSFLLGAAGGGVLANRIGDRHAQHIARALAVEVSLIGVAAVLAAVVDIRPNAVSGDIVIALLAFAMGVRNATVRRIGVPDLTTTVLTMTLTGLAAESPLAGGSGQGSVRRIAAVVAMFTGALAGALLLKTSLTLPLVAAAGLALVTC